MSEEALQKVLAESGDEEAGSRDAFTLPSYDGGGFLIDILDKDAMADALGDTT